MAVGVVLVVVVARLGCTRAALVIGAAFRETLSKVAVLRAVDLEQTRRPT